MKPQNDKRNEFSPINDENTITSPRGPLVPSKVLAERLIMARDGLPSRKSNPTISSNSSSIESSEESEDSGTISQRVTSKNADREKLRKSIVNLTKELDDNSPVVIKEEPNADPELDYQNHKEIAEELKDTVHEISSVKAKVKNIPIKYDDASKKEEEITISQLTILNPEGSKITSSQLTNINKGGESQNVGSQKSTSSNFLAGFTRVENRKSTKENKNESIKPLRLRFHEDDTKKENLSSKEQEKIEMDKRKHKLQKTSKKEFFQNYGTQENDEDLHVSSDQKEILELFDISFKKHKGNRALTLDPELTRLKEIPMKYKEVRF